MGISLRPRRVCSAEYKWLYAVLKNYFLKLKLLAANSPCMAEARRQALVLSATDAVGVANQQVHQGCDLLVHGVCRKFATFILGESAKLPGVVKALSGRTSDQRRRDSSASFMFNCSGNETEWDKWLFFSDTVGCRSRQECAKFDLG
ncbi:unnamed protein product [Peronospora destructor]|uniref:Uncharacterized protein n=1 Tax=Peronospora destructor TaxID=86335 RepID=A0AAV0T7S2_9STRA|nr:unnamed protein product [Peronospora destructor]